MNQENQEISGDLELQQTIQYYDKNAPEVGQRYEQAEMTFLYRQLQHIFTPYSRILELGCGTGRDLAWLHAQGFDVLGIDASLNMVLEAKKHHPEMADQIHQAILPWGLSSRWGTFQGALAIAILMHLNQKQLMETLGRLFLILEPGSSFFVSVPTSRVDHEGNPMDEQGRRFVLFSEQKWSETLLSGGFEVVESHQSEDGMSRPGVQWLNLITRRIP
jgi:2-polyprenyl-3-methyl-5-hydroxy-6-metoxy-1,4-benzoquinol methylase